MQLNCKVIKCANPPFFRVIPPFKIFGTPPSDSIFGRSYLPPPFNKGWGVGVGGSNYASTKETLLGNLIDLELSFDQHISSICSKASKKLHALGRIATFMSFNKHRTLMKAFIESQFNYCPLIWMFHSRTINNKINRIHERALRLFYSDDISSFNELLKKDQSFSIHHRNIQSLPIKLYKFFHALSSCIMKNVFHFNTKYAIQPYVTQ